jgi:hypothetical protein
VLSGARGAEGLSEEDVRVWDLSRRSKEGGASAGYTIMHSQEAGGFNSEVSQGEENVVRSQEVEGLNLSSCCLGRKGALFVLGGKGWFNFEVSRGKRALYVLRRRRV